MKSRTRSLPVKAKVQKSPRLVTHSSLVAVLALIVFVAAGIAWAAGEYCDEYVREDKEYGARVKADLKRYARSQGVPERLMYLYDQLGDCPYCIGGDADHPILPYMYIVYAEDANVRAGGLSNVRHRGTAWSADEEYAARQGMREGWVKAYYILLEETPCECCRASSEQEFDEWDQSEPDYEDSPTWNDDLRIDTSLSDAHESVDDLGPDPSDLTEIDDKDRYPDELPVPPLDLPPPVRPLTTGCGACQALVDEYNDVAVRINEQNRVVALHERRLRIGQIAIRLILRQIRAQERKAETDASHAEIERLWQRYGDLVGTSQEDQRQLDIQIAIRDELILQLAGLRQAVTDCETRCTLLDTQAEPTTEPEPLPTDAGPVLPPYVRIASQTCPQCSDALERRNALARDMNELVQGMIDAGINSNSIEAWEALRKELDAANAALNECVSRCSLPEESKPTLQLNADARNVVCPPCRKFKERADEKIKAHNYLWGKRRIVRNSIEQLQERLDKETIPTLQTEYENEIYELLAEEADLTSQLTRARNEMTVAKMRLRHCQVTLCLTTTDYYPDTSLNISQHEFAVSAYLAEARKFFFVTTSCEKCRLRANMINTWVLEVQEDWLTPQFLESLRGYPGADSVALGAKRLRLLEFISDLKAEIAELRDCERQYCPDTHGGSMDAAYQDDGIAPEACLEEPATETAIDTSSAEALPDACHGSWLEHWIQLCEESYCSGTADVAVSGNGPAASACSGDGLPIADFVADLGLSQWFSYPARACNLPSSPTAGVEIGAARGSQSILTGEPADPYFSTIGSVTAGVADQWGLQRVGAFRALAGDKGYALKAGRTIVAVIDSGIDVGHPDLAGMLWRNPGELPANGIDDDGNGYVDDVHGWNFVQNNADVQDTNGHGTLVAGIIAAAPDNGIGIAGINPWARIMAIKATNFLGKGNSVDVAAAITYAVNEGARVINVSLGGTEFSAVEQVAVRYAQSKGAVVVVAAGNLGTDAAAFWPAGLDNVITVAATEPDDRRARYSNWGSPVDVAAPGSNILSLRARHTDLMYFVEDDYPLGRNIIGDARMLYYASGTSFAAPFVSGIASLVLSVHPERTADEVRRMILHSATDTETPGIDPLTGFGVVDAGAALAADSAYHVDAAITGVSAVRRNGSVFVAVIGSTDADRFASAMLQIGVGQNPDAWQDTGTAIPAPVTDGPLGEIDSQLLRGSPTWTLRLVTTHEDGSHREARFELNLQ